MSLLSDLSARAVVARLETEERRADWLSTSPADDLEMALSLDRYLDARARELDALRLFHRSWMASERTGEGSVEAQLEASLEAVRP